MTNREKAVRLAPTRPTAPIKVDGEVTTLRKLAAEGRLEFSVWRGDGGPRYYAHLGPRFKWEVSEYTFKTYGGKAGE